MLVMIYLTNNIVCCSDSVEHRSRMASIGQCLLVFVIVLAYSEAQQTPGFGSTSAPTGVGLIMFHLLRALFV